MKKLFLILFVLLTSVSLVSCGGKEEEYTVTREEQFIVGMECNYAPFNWTENSKTPYNYPIGNFEGKYADGYD
ncbi:MAG TPA: ABC transporter substrate-binding protein, partial [Bacilli bacterium]|nr:ABC transporter substrate-binding protein [Bacilli bacterium]